MTGQCINFTSGKLHCQGGFDTFPLSQVGPKQCPHCPPEASLSCISWLEWPTQLDVYFLARSCEPKTTWLQAGFGVFKSSGSSAARHWKRRTSLKGQKVKPIALRSPHKALSDNKSRRSRTQNRHSAVSKDQADWKTMNKHSPSMKLFCNLGKVARGYDQDKYFSVWPKTHPTTVAALSKINDKDQTLRQSWPFESSQLYC